MSVTLNRIQGGGAFDFPDAISLQNEAVMLMQSGQAAKAKPLAERSIALRQVIAVRIAWLNLTLIFLLVEPLSVLPLLAA